MKRLGLVKDDDHNRDKWRSLAIGNRPTLTSVLKVDMKMLGLAKNDDAHNRDMFRSLTKSGNCPALSQCGNPLWIAFS